MKAARRYTLDRVYGGTNEAVGTAWWSSVLTRLPHSLDEVEEVVGDEVIALPDGRVVLAHDYSTVVAWEVTDGPSHS